MKAHRPLLIKFMTLVVGLVLCGVPECAQALQDGPAPQQNNQQQPASGVTVDPSQGPLQPVPSQNQPNVSPNQDTGIAPEPVPATPAPQPKPEQQMQQPLGAATAEGVTTVGGGASRPAGEAIAPAKQNQRRSLLIKIGLIAAAGVATGTVVALTKGTPSKP